MAPDLRDSNGISAFGRYWQSLIHWGDQLGVEGDWCAAYDKYQEAIAARNDAEAQAKAQEALLFCAGPTDEPTATLPFFSPTPTWTGAPPTNTDTPAAPSDTPVPSDTPIPSDTPTETPSATP
jgi:hypothetical protein